MMVTFLALVFTGLPLKFSQAPWASGLMHFLGGARTAGLVHRVCASITFTYLGTTFIYIIYFLFFKKIPGNPNSFRDSLVRILSALAVRIFGTSLG